MLSPKVVQIAVIMFLLVSLSFTTTAAFAYWRDVTVTTPVDVAIIGEGGELVVTDLSSSLEGQLVPEGRAYFVGDVDVVMMSYQVSVTRDLINEMDLVVRAHSILINDLDTYSHLIEIKIGDDVTEGVFAMFNEVVTITISIRLIEPIDEAEAIEKGFNLDRVNVEDSREAYNQIKGQSISFALSFELRSKSEVSE
ncbi:MAG: hypothetical protein ACNA7K_05050 [Acholeplasmataceae bacterium]